MTGFIYHIPGYGGTINHGSLSRRFPKLAEQFGKIGFDTRKVASHPSGKAGVIFTMKGIFKGDDEVGLRLVPKEQTWQKTKEGYWVGFWDEKKPTPEDLQRPMRQCGYRLPLNDEKLWDIPIIRHVETSRPALPEVMTYDAEGVLIFEPMQKYAELTHLAERVWRQALIDSGIDPDPEPGEGEGPSVVGEFEPMSTEDRWKFVTAGLAMNYYVGEAEIAMLKIITFNPELDQGNINTIATHMVDIPTVLGVMAALEAAKKVEGDVITQPGSAISNGEAG